MTSFERSWRGMKADFRLHLLSIFGVAVAFICLASVLVMVANVDALRQRWAHSGRATVFLEAGIGHERRVAIERALRDIPGVSQVTYVSGEEARHDLVSESGDDVIASLPTEAFPDSLNLALDPGAPDSLLASLPEKLERLPEVSGVETYQAWTQRLDALLSGGLTVAAMLLAIVLGAVISVVASTIRLSLERRRIEVDVLKIIGATDSYVRRPFVIEGAAQGAGGAVLAILVTGALYLIMRSHLAPEIVTLVGSQPRFLPWYGVVGLTAAGAMFGALAAHVSLRRLLAW